MVQHSHSCVRNSQSTGGRRLRWVYSLVPRYVGSSKSHNWMLLSVTMKRHPGIPCKILQLVFYEMWKPSPSEILWRILQLLRKSLGATCHSRCILSIYTQIPFQLDLVQVKNMELPPGHLSDEKQIHGRMECRHVSWLLLDSEDRCSGNLVQVTNKKVPCLIHLSSLLCPTFIQQYTVFTQI